MTGPLTVAYTASPRTAPHWLKEPNSTRLARTSLSFAIQTDDRSVCCTMTSNQAPSAFLSQCCMYELHILPPYVKLCRSYIRACQIPSRCTSLVLVLRWPGKHRAGFSCRSLLRIRSSARSIRCPRQLTQRSCRDARSFFHHDFRSPPLLPTLQYLQGQTVVLHNASHLFEIFYALSTLATLKGFFFRWAQSTKLKEGQKLGLALATGRSIAWR